MRFPSILARFQSMAQVGADLLFPPRCVGCGRAGHHLCPLCAQQVQPAPRPLCLRCGRPQPRATAECAICIQEHPHALTMIRAVALHTHPLRPAIHALKYEDLPDLAVDLARYLVAGYADPIWRGLPRTIDGVVPVPLHEERLAARGYNQSELLARAFCLQTKLPLQAGWIRRQRETRQQVGLNAEERRANVKDAFSSSLDLSGRAILLIDDVFTTGATLTACAHAARAAGADAVYALTLAMPMSSHGALEQDRSLL